LAAPDTFWKIDEGSIYSAVALTKIDVQFLFMIEFIDVQSAFAHYKRVLGSNGPVETRAKYHGDRLQVEHYHAYTGQFIIGAVFKKGAADKSLVALLPLTNMSGDLEQDFFLDGITEDIITALSRPDNFGSIVADVSSMRPEDPEPLGGLQKRGDPTDAG
jgi:hypothetical protein